MTVKTSTNVAVGLGNGVTTQFNYGFIIPDASMAVIVYTDAAGVQTVLSPTQYGITGLGDDNGGAVTYPLVGPPIAAGTSLTIRRVVPYTQPVALKNQANYFPEVVEAALDNLEMQIQQAIAGINTGIHYPASDVNPVSELVPAAQRAGKFFAFDGNGNPSMLPGNNLAGDLLAYSVGGAHWSNANYATRNEITFNATWGVEFSTALATIVYGFRAKLTRTAGADPNYTVGGQFDAIAANGVSSTCFAFVTEAWAQPGATSSLIGNEAAIINETNNNVSAKIGYYSVFKDRGDGVATVTQGLGANEYNLGAMAFEIASQVRSTAGEFCGWRRGIAFDEFAMDFDANGGAIGIDFAKAHYYGGTDPLVAYRMTAAIRLRDYQSILWNGDPSLPNDPTEPAINAVRTYLNSALGRLLLTTGGVEKWGIDVSNGDTYRQGVLQTGASLAGNNTWTGTNTYQNTVTLQTNLTFSGNGRRITGDFSNATLTNRVCIQTSTVNGNTDVIAFPNGASTQASFNVFNGTDLANAGFGHIAISNGEFSLQSYKTGAGVIVPMTFYVGNTEAVRISTTNNQLLVNTTSESSVAGAKARINGILVVDNSVGFMAHRNGTNLAIADITFTQVAMTTEEFDQNNSFSLVNSRFTPPAGKYYLSGMCGFSGGVDQMRIAALLYKNGAAFKDASNTVSGANAASVLASALVDANGTDFFELYVWQQSAGTRTLSGASFDTWFCGYRVG